MKVPNWPCAICGGTNGCGDSAVIHLDPELRKDISDEDLLRELQTRGTSARVKYGNEEAYKDQYERLCDDWGLYKSYMQEKYGREFPELKWEKVEYKHDR